MKFGLNGNEGGFEVIQNCVPFFYQFGGIFNLGFLIFALLPLGFDISIFFFFLNQLS